MYFFYVQAKGQGHHFRLYWPTPKSPSLPLRFQTKQKSRSLEGPPPCEQASKGPTGKWALRCTSTGQDGSNELDLEWIGPNQWLLSYSVRKVLSRRTDGRTNKPMDGDNSIVIFFSFGKGGGQKHFCNWPWQKINMSHAIGPALMCAPGF